MSIIRIAVFIPIVIVCIWELYVWGFLWRKRPEHGAHLAILVTDNIASFALTLVIAAAALLFGDFWELLLIPVAWITFMDLRYVAEWWWLDRVDSSGLVAPANQARSAFRFTTKVVPMTNVGIGVNCALLGTAANIVGNGSLRFDFWVVAVVCAVLWLPRPFLMAAIIGIVRLRKRAG